jgi:hypothetical protein
MQFLHKKLLWLACPTREVQKANMSFTTIISISMEIKINYIANIAPLLENIGACLEHIFVINFNRN